MCEFTVMLSGEVVARKIIKTKIKGNTLIMADVSGKTTSLENVSIVNVDTIMTEMILEKT